MLSSIMRLGVLVVSFSSMSSSRLSLSSELLEVDIYMALVVGQNPVNEDGMSEFA